VYDSQEKKRRYSGTKLTMLTAFGSVIWAFHWITVKSGFNETVFFIMAGIATGVGVAKAYGKKLDPEVQPPKEEPKE
jgi:hypothetical protein